MTRSTKNALQLSALDRRHDPSYISRTPKRIPKKLDIKTTKELIDLKAKALTQLTAVEKRKRAPNRRRKLALLLPAHDEELIMAATIKSAVAAGQPIEDIFVVDDASTDKTRSIAIKHLGAKRVLTVEHSGKGLAIHKALQHFKIESRYVWVHVADADSVFCPNYFRLYKRKLNAQKYSVAVGFVQSLRGNWISNYRAFCYTYGQHILRRFQSYLGMISVFPGPITCFKTDIIKDLDLTSKGLTEDFDITLQVHRKKLGKIKFIPEAVNYTQDPQTLSDFCNQNLRWQRGFFQGVTKYKVGRRLQKIDLSLGFQMFEALFYIVQMLIFVPYVTIVTHKWFIMPVVLLGDFLVVSALAIFSAVVAKRLSILASLPYFYFLRWIEIGIFMRAYVEVVIMHKFRSDIVGWSVKGRRYALDANALKDAAR